MVRNAADAGRPEVMHPACLFLSGVAHAILYGIAAFLFIGAVCFWLMSVLLAGLEE